MTSVRFSTTTVDFSVQKLLFLAMSQAKGASTTNKRPVADSQMLESSNELDVI